MPKKGESMDKIVAIVGDEVILKSDIDGQLYYMTQMDKSLKLDDKELRRKILDGLIDQLLLVSKAIKDSIVISDDEVSQRLELHIQSEIKRFGSESRLEQVYGMSVPKLKNEIRDKIRQNLLVQTLVSQKFADVKVTQKEIDEFFKEYRDSIPKLPPSVEIYHIVKKVGASNESKEEILKLAIRVRDSILAGGNFTEFAKRYSGDVGTANDGGDLGWFQKGKLFPEFEQAANKLSTGELSQPVETPFGYHLIQTIEKKTDAINTRHILFKMGESQQETESTINFLNDLRTKVAAGAPFDSLAKIFSDDKETKSFGGLLGKVSVNELPENLRNTIINLKDGETTEPMIYKSEQNNKSYNIIYKKRSLPERFASIKDDFREIEQMAAENKKRKSYEIWLSELRKELYWEVIDK